jgi:hypothetical protein
MLTKEFILSKNPKHSEISDIKTLNIWGQDITDISILSKMPNIEILSASSNNISSLSPLSSCLNMREIYLRNNNINSFEELRHLKPMTNLKLLWLEGNPLCNDILYRQKVLNILPQLISLDNIKNGLVKHGKIKARKRMQSEGQKKRKIKNDFDYDVNISKSDRKKLLLRRVFSYMDSTNDAKVIETSNDISIKQNHNNENKNKNKKIYNNYFSNKKWDLSDLRMIFNIRGSGEKEKEGKQFFRKLKLKIKKEEKKNNACVNNNNYILNNYLSGISNKVSRKKLTVENYPVSMPRIKGRDNNITVQNSISIESYKKNILKNISNIKNDKLFINNNNNCQNGNYVMQAIYLLVDKMNVNELISLKDTINQKISILMKN